MEGKTGLEPEMEMRTGKQEQGREEGEKRGSKGEIRNGGSSPDTSHTYPKSRDRTCNTQVEAEVSSKPKPEPNLNLNSVLNSRPELQKFNHPKKCQTSNPTQPMQPHLSLLVEDQLAALT